MADFHLLPRSALAPFIKAGHHGAPTPKPGVLIREVTNFSLAYLTAFKGKGIELSGIIEKHFGIELPVASKTTSKNSVTFISVGPSQWLALAESTEAEKFISTLETLAGSIAAIVDQSDARAIVEISGSMVRQTLEKGVSIDLHPTNFALGDAATTFAAHLWITLWQTRSDPAYRIAVFRGFGSPMLDWLINSGAEFGCHILGE